jgi:DNA-binding transcriptional LysR family regulator
MSYNLRHLKYFIATAELGQVSRAAVELSVSQSAVTAAIRELEATLGTALFQRSSLGMTLTEAGRRFLASGYEIIEKVEDSLRVRDTEALQGQLDIAASYTVMGYFLPVHLERLSLAMPGVNLNLREMTRTALEDALVDRKIDIGVALTSNIANPDIAKETLLSSPRRLWLPSRHPLLSRPQLRLSDVAPEAYVMLTVDEAAHTAMRYWGPAGFSPNVILRTSSIEAVRSMVANGRGVAILSEMVYRPWSLEGRRLETRNVSGDIPTMDVGVAWPRNHALQPAAKTFIDFMSRAFGSAIHDYPVD